MSMELVLGTMTNVTFQEIKPHSYTATPIGLIARIFDDPDLDRIKDIATNLLTSSVDPNLLSKEITIGAEAFNNCNAIINRLFREVELGINDNTRWSLLQNLLLKNGKPQKIISSLYKLNLINKNDDLWELLRIVEKHNSKEE